MSIFIRPPIILDETGAIDVFGSIEAAESYMEPIDVEDNRYVAFDSEGRLLRILTTPNVTLEAAEEVPNHVEQVREILIRLLRYCGSTDPDLSSLPLKELVQKSLPFKSR